MKKHSDITACIVDYGYFTSLAEKLAQSCAKVYYNTPNESEFKDIKNCVFGEGIPGVIRLDDFFEPEVFAEIDLFIFPDIGFKGLQKQLRAMGKVVWGSFDAGDLEVYRTEFVQWVQDLGLPLAPSLPVTGLFKLRRVLSRTEGKWVKVDRYRSQMETWFHQNELHSRAKLNDLERQFGGLADSVKFVVQDVIPTEIEVGYDGWTVDGRFPTSSYQGYEGKNEIYLGALCKYTALPKQVQQINEAIAPTLARFGYRNFIATELRVKDKEPFFIDPTMRMPGQTGEQLLETCENLAEVIWHGANGELIEPKFVYKFAASATIHYTEGGDNNDEWKLLVVPEQSRQWTKLVHYCMVDGVAYFPPSYNKELGVVIACGNTIEEVFAKLRKTTDSFGSEPVTFHLEKFFDLLDSIRIAEAKGMKFSDGNIPTNKQILEYVE